MLRFDFHLTESTFRLPDPNDPIYQLEEHVDQSHTLPPLKRLALLYNDAKNYIMGNIPPLPSWYPKRLAILQEYAALDWLAFGQHLLDKGEPAFQRRCQLIHDGLHALIKKKTEFDLALFCRTLSSMDSLWHVMFPRHFADIQDQAVKTLLEYFA